MLTHHMWGWGIPSGFLHLAALGKGGGPRLSPVPFYPAVALGLRSSGRPFPEQGLLGALLWRGRTLRSGRAERASQGHKANLRLSQSFPSWGSPDILSL